MKTNNLQLSLKKPWFDMTEAEIKKEDYRETTPYWYARLCLYDGKKMSKMFWECFSINNMDKEKISFKPFTHNIMTLGYPKSTDISRIIKLEHKGIEIKTGNPEWGAEEGKIYFVIKHGKRIQ